MMKRRILWGLSMAVAVCLATTIANAQTVLIGPGVNSGSFEDPLIGGSNPDYNYMFGAPTGWTGPCIIQDSPSGAYSVASEGDQGVAIASQSAGTLGVAVTISILLEDVFEADTLYTLTMDANSNTSDSVPGTWWMADTSGTHVEQKDFSATTKTWEAVEPMTIDTVLRPDFIGKYIVVGIWNGSTTQLWIDNINLVATPSDTPPPIPGDANYDGLVNDLDAAFLADNWLTQTGAIWAQGDFNYDGAVDGKDATILAANWQTSGVNAASVPEPTTIMLCVAGLALMLVSRYRRRLR